MISQFKYNNNPINNHILICDENDKIGSYILFQSYETIVACYQLDYSKLIIDSTKYSSTSTKQLNRFINSLTGAKKTVPLNKEEFEKFLTNWIK